VDRVTRARNFVSNAVKAMLPTFCAQHGFTTRFYV
jgi:hypothetical protein